MIPLTKYTTTGFQHLTDVNLAYTGHTWTTSATVARSARGRVSQRLAVGRQWPPLDIIGHSGVNENGGRMSSRCHVAGHRIQSNQKPGAADQFNPLTPLQPIAQIDPA